MSSGIVLWRVGGLKGVVGSESRNSTMDTGYTSGEVNHVPLLPPSVMGGYVGIHDSVLVL